MSNLPSFETFYQATHRGKKPFPWQRNLAAEVAANGWRLPIGVPTGLGKTACIDIAVWALAGQAERHPRERTVPTRTWYVVNRRLLVDAAYEHGERLRGWLNDPESICTYWRKASPEHVQAVTAVADALSSIARLRSDHGPLHVTRLRGGADLGARVPDPSQPALVFATVPMFASRWLFRGYGSSSSMRPVDAALAGIDSLVLLDEAHLAMPLARLTGPLQQCDVDNPADVLPGQRTRPQFIELTATGADAEQRFDLDEEDFTHPVVRQRLDAPKLTTLLESKKARLAGDLATAAVRILREAPESTSCLVFANTPATAREVHAAAVKLAEKEGISAQDHLLTGRMREREAELARNEILDEVVGAPSDRAREVPRDRHLLVVATQTLEVGADVDFDHLITETAGVRSMVQRFGRLNRLGRYPDASATVVHPTDGTEWPVYGTEPKQVWERLRDAASEGFLTLSPRTIGKTLGEPDDEPPQTGELLPHHLWDWAKTSLPRPPATPPELFYDRRDQTIEVSVMWRAYIPRPAVVSTARKLVPAVSGDEAVQLSPAELRQALVGRGLEKVDRLSSDGKTVETVSIEELRPGNQVVLPVQVGMYDKHGWNPDSSEPVLDVSLLRAGLVLDRPVIGALFAEPENIDDGQREYIAPELKAALDTLWGEPHDDEDQEKVDDERIAALTTVVEILEDWDPPASLMPEERQGWRAWRESLFSRLKNGTKHLTWLSDGSPFIDVPVSRRRGARAEVRSDAFDDLTFVDEVSSPQLDAHHRIVGEIAAAIAQRVGLADELVEAVRLAGATHDLGKLEPRFQRWLDPEGSAAQPLAKSSTPWYRREATRAQSGWPRGARHELLSARLLEAALDENDPWRDLIVHLVITHHGHGRPTVNVVADAFPTKVRAGLQGADVVVEGNLALSNWDQPSRFRRLCETYGYWGLAFLEAIVRQADHVASAQAEVA